MELKTEFIRRGTPLSTPHERTNKNKVELKEEFISRSRELLGSDADEYFKILEVPLTDSFRINTLKIKIKELTSRLEAEGWKLREVPWCKEGYWVDYRSGAIGNTIEHFLGYYYAQEPASMIPPLLMELKSGQVILDMAASPGSKTGQIAGLINDDGLIVANDVRIDRTSILKYNMQRIGVKSVIVTRRDANSYARNGEAFDRVLIDAPCSGEGIIRKNPYVAVQWSHKSITKFASAQRRLILSAYKCLKPDGIMVYSTCSLAPEENEDVVNYLLKNTNAVVEKASLKGLKARAGVTEWQGQVYDKSVKHCLRVYPQDNDTEGFFIAKIRKGDDN
ncbi:MAG: NOL1/NOP2/sun family putative RNA methylase [Candidatus Nanoarchaeia archaeon]